MYSCKCFKLLLFLLLLFYPLQGNSEEISRLTVGSLQANCYILTNENTKEALVIDPGDEGQEILLHLGSRGLRIAGIIATHAHRDHLGAAKDLQEITGTPVRIHRADLKKAKSLYPKVRFSAINKDGPLIVGPFELQIFHTPGHTPGSICAKWKDQLFSGDTLFLETIGKSTQQETLVKSIREKLWILPDSTAVYPGHGNVTTIGHEKRNNPFARELATSAHTPIQWIESYSTALTQAKEKNKILLLLLTVNKWPCAQGYCDAVLQDNVFIETSLETINCRLDVTAHPQYLQKYELSKAPSRLPAVILLDAKENILDILEKPTAALLCECLEAVLSGERPYERFKELVIKPQKNCDEYIEMADFQTKRNQTIKAIPYLEKARTTVINDLPTQIKVQSALLEAYSQTGANDQALAMVDLLMAHPTGSVEVNRAEITFKKASLYYKKKEYSKSQEILSEFLKRYGQQYDPSPAWLLTGICHLAKFEYKEAMESFKKVSDKTNSDLAPKSLYLQGYCYIIQQEYDLASELFAALVRDHPDSDYAGKATDYLSKIQRSNPVQKAQKPIITQLDESLEFIERWYICGPFPKKGHQELLNQWANPEKQKAPLEDFFKEHYSSKTGNSTWVTRELQTVEMPSADALTGKVRSLEMKIINFLDAFPETSVDSSAYALAFIESDKEQTRTILTGSDDGITLWLNGQEIHRSATERPIVPDEDFAIGRFRPGVNFLLVEVTNARGYWGFTLRLSGTGKAPPPPLLIDSILP